jgi:hypothetical protein
MITRALHQYTNTINGVLARRAFATANEGTFKFPKHKELFAEDYYDAEGEKNPYDKAFAWGQDYDNFDKGAVKSTPTGILANYKK